MIPAEAVAAAAKALYIDQGGDPLAWAEKGHSFHDYYQRRVTHILEAAAPYIESAMLEAGWQEPPKPYIT